MTSVNLGPGYEKSILHNKNLFFNIFSFLANALNGIKGFDYISKVDTILIQK